MIVTLKQIGFGDVNFQTSWIFEGEQSTVVNAYETGKVAKVSVGGSAKIHDTASNQKVLVIGGNRYTAKELITLAADARIKSVHFVGAPAYA